MEAPVSTPRGMAIGGVSSSLNDDTISEASLATPIRQIIPSRNESGENSPVSSPVDNPKRQQTSTAAKETPSEKGASDSGKASNLPTKEHDHPQTPVGDTIPSLKEFETATPGSSLKKQDKCVYGNLNQLLADALAERIEAAITEGVDSLPLLDDDCYRSSKANRRNSSAAPGQTDTPTKSPKQRLWDKLRYKFVRNVDVLEAYCAHHVLTLRKHPPARRKRIVAVLQHGEEVLPKISSPYQPEGEETPTERMPTKEEIPSPEDQKSLFDEVTRLQEQLQAARDQRNALLATVESTKRAQEVVQNVVATVEAHAPELAGTVKQAVTDKVESSNTLRLLGEEARNLKQTLETIKRERLQKKSSSDDNEAHDFVQRDDPLDRASHRLRKKHKPLSLEEAYREDRRKLGGFAALRDSTNSHVSEDAEREDESSSSSLGPKLRAIRSMVLPGASSSVAAAPAPRTPQTPTY